MTKGYKDRAMKVEEEQTFIFPKEGKVIKAKNREEAEKKLQETNDAE